MLGRCPLSMSPLGARPELATPICTDTPVACRVIHCEHDKDYGDKARPSVIGSVHGGAGVLSGYLFDNITVEGPVFRPIGL